MPSDEDYKTQLSIIGTAKLQVFIQSTPNHLLFRYDCTMHASLIPIPPFPHPQPNASAHSPRRIRMPLTPIPLSALSTTPSSARSPFWGVNNVSPTQEHAWRSPATLHQPTHQHHHNPPPRLAPLTGVLNIHNRLAIILISCYLAKIIDGSHGNHLQIEIP